MKLTPQQIQFINDYLEKAGIRHLDIRIEIADHIATALEENEGEFGENFSRYMLANKEALLEQNETFRNIAREKAYGCIRKGMAHPAAIFVAAAALAGIAILPQYTAIEKLTAHYSIAFSLGVLLLFCVLVAYRVFGKYSYSVTDRLLWTTLLLGCMINAYRFLENNYLLLAFFSVGTYMSLVFIIAFYKTVRSYKLKYKMELI